MINIVVIKPYDGIEGIIQEAFDEHPRRENLSFQLIDTRAEKALQANQPMDYQVSADTDVVIARYFSAQHFRQKRMKCVEIAMTGYDVVLAVNKCIDLYNPTKIAVFAPQESLYEAGNLIKIYHHLDFILEAITSLENLVEQMERALAQGVDSVVGGSLVVNYAQSLGLPGSLIQTSKSNITKSINDAIHIAEIMRKENEENVRLRGIMDYSFGGIISTDADGRIILINRYAKKFFELHSGEEEDKHIRELFPQLSPHAVKGEEVITEELVRVRGTLITFNLVPITSKNRKNGVVITFQKAEAIQELEGKIRSKIHEKGFRAKYSFPHIIAESPVMRECVETAKRYSQVNSNVLLVGETGTGKEMFAQGIHNESPRRNGPFVAVNCAALPEQLLESELFGYVDGAFTGAAKGGKAGLFEIAHNGTIFLDEILDISAKLQGRLLRVIQEREIIRLGHDRVTSIDVRIISASNQDLQRKVSAGEFRSDLLYRLDVLKLELPPLHQRGDDVLLLADYFITHHDFGFAPVLREISPGAKALLLQHSWPGNIRELRNFCERLCVICDAPVAEERHIRRALETHAQRTEEEYTLGPAAAIEQAERLHIQDVLRRCGGKRVLAAEKLGWSKSTLWRKMKKYGLH